MKNILIFGGMGGIGSRTAKLLMHDDYNIGIVYRSGKGLVDKHGNENISYFQMDLLNTKSIEQGFSKIAAVYKKIDVIVFSVSLPIENKRILNTEWEDYKKHIDLQLGGLHSILRNLKDQIIGGNKIKFIIILSEYCIGVPPSGISHYVSAKYALMGMAKSMSVELSKYNCTVNMISPGMVDTELISNLPPKLIEITKENNPLKRIATPEDVANLVLFMSSDKSDYINGANIPVNGGSKLV